MKFRKLLPLSLVAVMAVSCGQQPFQSPNQLIRADIQGQSLSVYYRDTVVLKDIHLGLISESQNLDSALVLKDESAISTIADSYTMPAGKRRQCSYSATGKTFTFQNPKGETLGVEVRLYNDGVAIRYITPEGLVITSDRTTYNIADGVNRWIATYDAGFEQPYPLATNGEPGKDRTGRIVDNGDWGYPALLEPRSGVFALIAEADVRRGDCCTYLNNKDNHQKYEVRLCGNTAFHKGVSPWRCAIIGGIDDIAESTLITDLATPSQIADQSWIKPGVSSWIYWAYNHGSKDFEICRQYIDLASAMHWPYCLVDWEWPEMTNGGNIDDVMAYAKDKGVGINLWYNSGTAWVGDSAPQPQDRLNSAENREREFLYLENLGVKGVKVDFFSPAAPDMVDYYLDILEDAARHHLLVDFHGCTIPNGWQRTWPNMMSMEGIYGAEWYNNFPFMTPAAACHNATVPFTRNVVGPMDYTPGSFTDSQHPHITTNAHELALPILFESGLQHMADRPSGYDSIPEQARAMYSRMPSAWDDTRLLSGYPGKYVVMARKAGNAWYVAGINGTDEPMDISFPLLKLGLSSVKGQLFCDGGRDREIELRDFQPAEGTATIPCRARGGFVAVIE